MDPSTLTTATFLLNKGGSLVAGTVAHTATTATFVPSANLAANSVYTVSITTGAKDLSGNPLAADDTWQFTTGNALDTTPPAVVSTTPVNNATNLSNSVAISATFSEPIAASTLTTATFIVSTGGSPIAGTVAYAGTTAIFSPAARRHGSCIHRDNHHRSPRPGRNPPDGRFHLGFRHPRPSGDSREPGCEFG